MSLRQRPGCLPAITALYIHTWIARRVIQRATASFMTFFWFPVFFYCSPIHQQLSESLSISATCFWKLVKFNSKKKLVMLDVQNPGVGFIRNFLDVAARGKGAHQSVELCMVLSSPFNRILQGSHSHFSPHLSFFWCNHPPLRWQLHSRNLVWGFFQTLQNDIIKSFSEGMIWSHRNLWGSVWL